MAKRNERKNETRQMVVATNISATVNQLKKKATPLVKLVENFTIITKDDQSKMVDMLKKIKAYGVQAETEQASLVDPAKKIIANSKALFAPFLESVEEATKLGKSKIKEFVDARLLEAIKVQADYESGKIKKVGTAISKTSELLDNDNARKIWKLEITRPGLIPRKFLVPDEAAIREALKKGKKVSGCKMVQETTIAI